MKMYNAKDIDNKDIAISVKNKLDFMLLVEFARKNKIKIDKNVFARFQKQKKNIYFIVANENFFTLDDFMHNAGGYKTIEFDQFIHGLTLKSAFDEVRKAYLEFLESFVGLYGLRLKRFFEYLKSVFDLNYIRLKKFLKRYYLTICNIFTAIIYFSYGVNYNESYGYWLLFGLLILNYFLQNQLERNERMSDRLIDLYKRNSKQQDINFKASEEISNAYQGLYEKTLQELKDLKRLQSLKNRKHKINNLQ